MESKVAGPFQIKERESNNSVASPSINDEWMKMKLHVVEISSVFLFVFEHRNMKCISCEGNYDGDAGACRQCYEDLKAKVAFLAMSNRDPLTFFTDVVLYGADDGHPKAPARAMANKAVLVHHLRDLCQKFFVSNLNWDNSLATYTFGHHHNDKQIIDAALTLITNNIEKLASSVKYAELKKSHPQLVIEIYERHFASL
ncbi:BTB/POZ domain-containing protein [Prunus dulcis]|uniref:BTB/POZ domain-containing protein n=1 Tax=Prunus dulcis TaxID=3755 RepID=A0A4Y1R0M1_PRUDU|nr:BTB/POZ domain-containing protein [Prunus dulcis]